MGGSLAMASLEGGWFAMAGFEGGWLAVAVLGVGKDCSGRGKPWKLSGMVVAGGAMKGLGWERVMGKE